MPDTTCGAPEAPEAQCVCALTEHPSSEPHECECGGSWTYSAEGEFKIITMPRSSGLIDPISMLLFRGGLGRFFND